MHDLSTDKPFRWTNTQHLFQLVRSAHFELKERVKEFFDYFSNHFDCDCIGWNECEWNDRHLFGLICLCTCQAKNKTTPNKAKQFKFNRIRFLFHKIKFECFLFFNRLSFNMSFCMFFGRLSWIKIHTHTQYKQLRRH